MDAKIFELEVNPPVGERQLIRWLCELELDGFLTPSQRAVQARAAESRETTQSHKLEGIKARTSAVV